MRRSTRILLCGDVMPARGIDQVLPHPGDPTLWEPALTDARAYVTLAERRAGPIPRPMPLAGPWGDAVEARARFDPDAFVINLETSITARGHPWPKGINYRLHPRNAGFLGAASVSVASLANNHVLDFDRDGLLDTLDAVERAGVRGCGAGRTLPEARAPAEVPLPTGRLRVFGLCTEDSGVPGEWAATGHRSGVWLVRVPEDAAAVATAMTQGRQPGDVVVASIHWGSNWGYEVPPARVRFAHALVDAGVDLVHGHSSHHPRPLEVYRGRLVTYGCGDFLNDYEGIAGYERWRPELVLLYAATLGPDGALAHLALLPFEVRGFTLRRASHDDARWLAERLTVVSAPFGARLRADVDGIVLEGA